jgi:hypothetical protein
MAVAALLLWSRAAPAGIADGERPYSTLARGNAPLRRPPAHLHDCGLSGAWKFKPPLKISCVNVSAAAAVTAQYRYLAGSPARQGPGGRRGCRFTGPLAVSRARRILPLSGQHR